MADPADIAPAVRLRILDAAIDAARAAALELGEDLDDVAAAELLALALNDAAAEIADPDPELLN